MTKKKTKKPTKPADFEKFIAVTPRSQVKRKDASLCEYCTVEECEVALDLEVLETLHGIMVRVVKCPYKIEE